MPNVYALCLLFHLQRWYVIRCSPQPFMSLTDLFSFFLSLHLVVCISLSVLYSCQFIARVPVKKKKKNSHKQLYIFFSHLNGDWYEKMREWICKIKSVKGMFKKKNPFYLSCYAHKCVRIWRVSNFFFFSFLYWKSTENITGMRCTHTHYIHAILQTTWHIYKRKCTISIISIQKASPLWIMNYYFHGRSRWKKKQQRLFCMQ